MKRIITIFIIFLTNMAIAQENPLYQQYLSNLYLLNPAVGGSLEDTEVKTNFRRQWVGFEGAPTINSINFHTRLFEGRASNIFRKVGHGIGATLYNEKEGPVQLFGLSASYAYHIPMGKFQIAAGLSLSASSYGIDYTKLTYGLDNDPVELKEDLKHFLPDADAGFFIYENEHRYYAGFTAGQLVRGSLKFSNTDSTKYNGMGRQYIFTGGLRFIDNPRMKMGGSLATFLRQEYMKQNEVHLNSYISLVNYLNRYNNEIVTFHFSYRTNRAFVAQLELGMANLYMAYAYEYSFSKIQMYTDGSHNITVGVRLEKYGR